MKPGGSAALAIGVGYVLGRRHKLRAALMLGAAAASGRLVRGQAAGSKEEGAKRGSGLVGKLGGTGKTAAIGVVTRSVDRIGDRLNEKAASLRQSGSSGEEDK